MGRWAVFFAGCVLVATVLAVAPGTERRGEAATSSQFTVYVTDFDGGMVPIDVATNTAGTPINVGVNPVRVAITPDGATAYVANRGSGTVTPIDVATNTPGTPINVGAEAYDVAITPDGATAYVTNNIASG